ncbi:MAG: phosphoribosylamine--glycine ligase [Bacilli bacterium]|jgi:phosphoribosylamine--glycine ligase|nr:phosphoribosylamine--glycine ligase [Bacilli bacterium]
MKILVVGSGGREHAIVKKVKQSPLVDEVICTPGNYGISLDAKCVDIKVEAKEEILNYCLNNNIELVIVGPEASLVTGISDLLNEKNIKVLGCSKKASQIESSKAYAKMIMEKYDIPSAKYQRFSDYESALKYVDNYTYPCVIKYDGLASGKGVYITEDYDSTKEVLNDLLNKRILGNDDIIIEEFLDGDEFTILSLVNGEVVVPFQSARDFKRVYDYDEGLNTGGMGAICPYHNIDNDTYQEGVNILKKTAQALLKEDNKYCGVLYGGFIKTKDGVKVIEFNARFGDPETQAVLNNLESDLVAHILDLLANKSFTMNFKKETSVGLVLSAPGYPEEYEKGIILDEYLKLPFDIIHMGTKLLNDKVVSNGGRVLFILNEDHNSKQAFKRIYFELDKIKNNVLHYRHDLNNY